MIQLINHDHTQVVYRNKKKFHEQLLRTEIQISSKYIL